MQICLNEPTHRLVQNHVLKKAVSLGFIEKNNNEIWGELVVFKILKADFYLTFILKINLPIVKFSLYEPTRCKFCKIIEKVQSRLHREKYKINSRCISRPMHFPLNMSYLTDSDIVFTLKLESRQNFCFNRWIRSS